MLLQEHKKLFEDTTEIKAIFDSNGVMLWPKTMPSGPDYSEPFYLQNNSNENETLTITTAYEYSKA